MTRSCGKSNEYGPRLRGPLALTSLLGAVAVVGACGQTTPDPAASQPGARTDLVGRAESCARTKPGKGATRQDVGRSSGARDGGAVGLARLGERSLAYVADEDTGAIHTVDLDKKKELATTRVAGSPAQLVVLEDGRVAATLRDRGTVVVLEPDARPEAPLRTLCTRSVGAEPFGLSVTPDDGSLLVTTAWDAALVVLETD